eukprot:m.111910 g.111910  ORF g.111910 m.111910 type:complete len:161 (+) comp37437_c0_seq14:340-822(+)
MSCEIASLGSHPFGPCFLVNFKDITLLLDCALDLSSLRYFLPLPLIPSRRISGLSSLQGSSLPNEISDKLKEARGQFFLDGQLEFCTAELDAVDLSTVDAILISCYQNMLGLPYVTEAQDNCFLPLECLNEIAFCILFFSILDLKGNCMRLSQLFSWAGR